MQQQRLRRCVPRIVACDLGSKASFAAAGATIHLLMERLGVQPAPGSQTYVAMPRRQKTRPRAVSQHRRSEGALPTEPDPLGLG